MGPNIADWPEMLPLKKHLLLKVAGSYQGSVTTDELIPSGEASSFRSNPEKISEYTMISRDPKYVGRAKAIRKLEAKRRGSDQPTGEVMFDGLLYGIAETQGCHLEDITFGSVMVSEQIGDGSSREQAASCQKVLGGFANLASEYATKRYRSNLINWGILPLRTEALPEIPVDSYLFLPNVESLIEQPAEPFEVQMMDSSGKVIGTIPCVLDSLTEEEKKILLAGSLINYYKG